MEKNRLREVRLLKRITQEDLERRVGISQSRISLIENGHVEPNDHEKRVLARNLRVRIRDLWSEPVNIRGTSLLTNGEGDLIGSH